MATNSRDESLRFVFQVTGNEQIDAIGKSIQDLANSSSEFAPKAQAMLDQLNKLSAQTGAVDNFVALKAAAGETGDKLSTAQAGLAALNAEFNRADTSSRSVTSSFAKAEAEVQGLTLQHNRLTAQVTTAGGALRAQGIDTDHLDQAHRTLQTSLGGVLTQAAALEQQTKRTGDETKGAGDKAKESGTLFGGLKDKLGEIITIAAAVELALKGIEFGKESLGNAAALEAQLSRVKAAAQGASVEFEGMEAAVEKAAQATNTTSQNAAIGLTALVNSGKSAKDAVDALVPTLQLAKIANIDAGTAAGLLAKNLDAFNIPASDAAKVVDLLTAASHGSATALQSISDAAAKLGPDAKALGLDFDSTAGLLGLLSSKGLDAGESVRSLRTLFQDLRNYSSPLRSELRVLGDDTSNFNTAIGALSSGTPRANQALLTLHGGARTLVELLGQAGPDALQKFTTGLQRQSGVAQSTAAILDDNLKGASTRFGLSIEAIGEKLAKPVLEPFKNEVNKLALELNKFAESPDFKKIEGQVGEIATNGAKALDNFLHGIDWKTFLDDAQSSLTTVVDGLKSVADSASTIASIVNKSAAAIGTAYHGVAGSIDAAVGASARYADGIISLEQHLADAVGAGDKFRATMEGTRAVVQSVGDEALANLDDHTTKLRKDVADLTGDTEKAASATRAHGDAAKTAAASVEAHADATNKAAGDVKQLTIVLQPIPDLVHASAQAAQTFGDKLADAAKKARAEFEAANISEKAEKIESAFKELRISSQEQLAELATTAAENFAKIDAASDNTAVGLANKRNAFAVYAKAALDAVAGLDEGEKASTRAQLEAQAAALGLTDALKILEAQASETGNALTDEAKRAEDAARRQRVAQDELAAAQFNAGVQANIAGDKAAEATDKAEKGFTEWGDAADQAALATKGVSAETSHANEGMDQLTNGIANARAGFLGVSAAAAQAYDTILKGAFDVGHSDDGAGFDRVARAMTTALNQVNTQIADDRAQLRNMVGDVENVGQAGAKNFGSFGNDAGTAAQRMRDLAGAIADGSYQVGILGKQDLAPLQAALEAAAQRAQQLADQAKGAAQQLADLNDQIQDEIDQENGDQASQEDRRHQKQLKNLEDLAKQAGNYGTNAYNEAVQKENQLHELKMRHLQQQAAQQQANQQQSSGSSSSSSSSSGGSSGGGGGLGGGGSGIAPTRVVQHVLPTAAGNINAYVAEEHSNLFEGFIDALIRAKGNSI